MAEKRKCVNGHEMADGAKFCGQCGSPPEPTDAEKLVLGLETISRLQGQVDRQAEKVSDLENRLNAIEQKADQVATVNGGLGELRQKYDEHLVHDHAEGNEAPVEREGTWQKIVRWWKTN